MEKGDFGWSVFDGLYLKPAKAKLGGRFCRTVSVLGRGSAERDGD